MAVESSSVVATKTDLRLYRGDTFQRDITVTDEAGAPFDFTGAALAFKVKTKAADATNLISLSIGSGITINSNVISLEIADTATAALLAGEFAYDLKFTSSGGVVTTWMTGSFIVEQNIS